MKRLITLVCGHMHADIHKNVFEEDERGRRGEDSLFLSVIAAEFIIPECVPSSRTVFGRTRLGWIHTFNLFLWLSWHQVKKEDCFLSASVPFHPPLLGIDKKSLMKQML